MSLLKSETARKTNGRLASVEGDLESVVEALRRDVNSLVESLQKTGTERAEEYRDALGEILETIGASSRSFVDTTRKEAVKLEDEVVGRITRNPLQSIAIAAGAGFLLALMTRRN